MTGPGHQQKEAGQVQGVREVVHQQARRSKESDLHVDTTYCIVTSGSASMSGHTVSEATSDSELSLGGELPVKHGAGHGQAATPAFGG